MRVNSESESLHHYTQTLFKLAPESRCPRISRISTMRMLIVAVALIGVVLSHALYAGVVHAQTVPSAPTNLDWTASTGSSLTFEWDDPSDSSITHYDYRIM